MQEYCLYLPEKSKPRLLSELDKQQYTVTLFGCNHLAHVIVLWQMQKFNMYYFTVFALSFFEFKGNFRVQTPWGLYLKGPAIYRRFFCVMSLLGAYIWRGS